MLQSIKRALKVNPNDPRVHGCLVRFQRFIETSTDLAGPVKQVLGQETQSIFTTKTAKERNEQFIQKHRESLDHRVQGKHFSRIFLWDFYNFFSDFLQVRKCKCYLIRPILRVLCNLSPK